MVTPKATTLSDVILLLFNVKLRSVGVETQCALDGEGEMQVETLSETCPL